MGLSGCSVLWHCGDTAELPAPDDREHGQNMDREMDTNMDTDMDTDADTDTDTITHTRTAPVQGL